MIRDMEISVSLFLESRSSVRIGRGLGAEPRNDGRATIGACRSLLNLVSVPPPPAWANWGHHLCLVPGSGADQKAVDSDASVTAIVVIR